MLLNKIKVLFLTQFSYKFKDLVNKIAVDS